MDEVAIFLELYNDVRPHETIGNLRPIDVFDSLNVDHLRVLR